MPNEWHSWAEKGGLGQGPSEKLSRWAEHLWVAVEAGALDGVWARCGS